MDHRWTSILTSALVSGLAGCAHGPPRASDRSRLDAQVTRTAHHPGPDPAPALAIPPAPVAPALSGPQPLEVYIRRALVENRKVQAARFNILALENRIPQVTTLEDPIVSNTIFPIPAVAPQFSLMGYMPYDMLIAQQFPWFGTLRLRGRLAEQDVKVALQELAAAELDAVEAVKRAYFDLRYAERAEALLRENRELAADFLDLARDRYRSNTATQIDVRRAEVALSDIDRELESNRLALAESRAELARQVHADPESNLATIAAESVGDVPAEVQRLYQLASMARPDLRGRLEVLARDEKAIELARKRFYPNLTLGFVYQDMTRQGAVSPTASGSPNIGLFVGFNLPVYRHKYRAGVCEAEARHAADAMLLEDETDRAHRDIKGLFTQARVQQNILGLLRRTNLPAAQETFELTASDYRAGTVDYLALLSAWRDWIQVRLQIDQVESELGKALAALERAVGGALCAQPTGRNAEGGIRNVE